MTNSIQQSQTDILTLDQQTIERRNIYGNLLEELSINEQSYFNLIVKYTTKFTQPYSISMKQFQSWISSDYDNTDTFVTLGIFSLILS